VTGGRTWQKWAAAAGCIPGIGGRTANLFSDRSPSGTLPTGVAVIEVADSASIAESIVMVNVADQAGELRLQVDDGLVVIEARSFGSLSD
jgi:hypothetical protein